MELTPTQKGYFAVHVNDCCNKTEIDFWPNLSSKASPPLQCIPALFWVQLWIVSKYTTQHRTEHLWPTNRPAGRIVFMLPFSYSLPLSNNILDRYNNQKTESIILLGVW